MTARANFRELIESTGDDFELDRAALLIAAEEYPALSVETYLTKIDRLAERVDSRLYCDAGPHETLERMTQVLVEEEGFSGNASQYHDPRNSFLNEVLDRHLGIPITLSTLYLEVARRISFDLQAVGYPGHFLVKHASSDEEIVVDPFHGGSILGHEELQSRLNTCFGGRVQHEPKLLRPTSRRMLLFRMLGNLKSIYLRERDSARALAAVERMLLLAPNTLGEQRDRGVLLARLERPLEAVQELARYRQSAPDAPDADDVDALIEQLKTKIGMSN